MSGNVFVEIEETSVGEDQGYDVTVSDDHDSSEPQFISQAQLSTS